VSEGGDWFIADKEDPTCVRYLRTRTSQHGTVCTRATAFAHLIPQPAELLDDERVDREHGCYGW
jgi:hypothetical protein